MLACHLVKYYYISLPKNQQKILSFIQNLITLKLAELEAIKEIDTNQVSV